MNNYFGTKIVSEKHEFARVRKKRDCLGIQNIKKFGIVKLILIQFKCKLLIRGDPNTIFLLG